jgi:basic membrane lipoprotein Med (substrate-binding protein (PBP1-ABC) superfamily)
VVETTPTYFRSIRFANEQAGYLAGTLAGLVSDTETIGALGGPPFIVQVVDYVEGYRNGAQYANPDTVVLINYADSFDDPEQGIDIAEAQLAQGADIIFTVAGATGESGLLYATQEGAFGIGVDVDEYISLFDEGSVAGADRMLSSAMIRLDNAVYRTIAEVMAGEFAPGLFRFGLADGGVGLAPYYETEGSVTDSIRGVLNRVERGIINGLIDPLGECPATLPDYLFLPNTVRSPVP